MEVVNRTMVAVTPQPKRVRRDGHSTLPHYLDVEIVSQEHFDELASWVRSNIPSTERYTPKYVEPEWGFDEGPQKIRFRFRHEDQAMAFKLIL
jgi:hypothetical protein